MDRLDCDICDNEIDLISLDGTEFPKGTIYVRSIKIPLELTPLRYQVYKCNNCKKEIKCLTIVSGEWLKY